VKCAIVLSQAHHDVQLRHIVILRDNIHNHLHLGFPVNMNMADAHDSMWISCRTSLPINPLPQNTFGTILLLHACLSSLASIFASRTSRLLMVACSSLPRSLEPTNSARTSAYRSRYDLGSNALEMTVVSLSFAVCWIWTLRAGAAAGGVFLRVFSGVAGGVGRLWLWS